jgi:hypothetical protein
MAAVTHGPSWSALTPQQHWFLTELAKHPWRTPHDFAGKSKPASRTGRPDKPVTRDGAQAVLRRLVMKGLAELLADSTGRYRITEAGREVLRREGGKA